uniref:Lysosomal protein transmembrane 4 beta n=1 Tax=Nothobranchius furzeri TaxID=105023 RepID=A0A8C6M464_NOTFU
MISPWDRWYSTSCCLCCHVRTGTIILGIWYMIINAVVLLILLSALYDPVQYRYHLTSSELGTDIDVMDDANICIATAISLLMILICGMATYGAYKQHAAWIIPFFCYQIFDFALNTLVAISVVVYPNTVQDYLQQLVRIQSPMSADFFFSSFLTFFVCIAAGDISLQRGHHVHQQYVPSLCSPPLHWLHPLLQGLSDRLRVELLQIRERQRQHGGPGLRHHKRHREATPLPDDVYPFMKQDLTPSS